MNVIFRRTGLRRYAVAVHVEARPSQIMDPARARQKRKQRRREERFRAAQLNRQELNTSERLAALCDLAWRRRHGQRPDPARLAGDEPLSDEERAQVERVLVPLDRLAGIWHELPIGGELVFTWPSSLPARVVPGPTHALRGSVSRSQTRR